MKQSGDDRLDSWKEIAAYLRRGVRTVQRWERSEGLPVRRHQHRKLGSVYALKPEVAAWWASRGSELNEQEQAAAAPAGSAAGERIRLLVLPFENLSGDSSQDYLADGFTEEMITQLAGLQPERMAVIARATAMHYRGAHPRVDSIARELRVDYVLQGSVRPEKKGVRVAAQLVQARDQTHLWAETYDRDLRNALALESEVAGAIASQIQLALSPRARASLRAQRAVHPAAFNDYLKGRYHLNRTKPDGLVEAVAWLRRAVKKAPAFPLAHAGLAHAYALQAMAPFDLMPPRQVMPRAKAAARKAVELDDRLPEAHAALGVVLHHYDWDWPGAEQSYRRALELKPEYAGARLQYAWLLLALSRRAAALAEIDRAQQIAQETDPQLLVVIRATRASALYFAREYDRCVAECRDALQLDSTYFLLRFLLARAQARQGALDKAASALGSGVPEVKIPLMVAALGLIHAVAGRQAEAAAALRRLHQLARERYVPATYFGIFHAGLGDNDAALDWLEKAYRERADGLTLLNVEPMADGLRDAPRFRHLIQRIGLPVAPPA